MTTMLATLTLAFAFQTAPAEDADARARVDAPPPAGITAVYDFDLDHVDGEVLSPTGVDIPAAHQIRFPSLIQIRGTFVRELVRMADDI